MNLIEITLAIAFICLMVLSVTQIGVRNQSTVIAIGVFQTCLIMVLFSGFLFSYMEETCDTIILVRILSISAFLAIVNTAFWRR